MGLKGLSPSLYVSNLEETLEYYSKILGFRCASRMSNEWAKVERDGISILFNAEHDFDKEIHPVMTGSIYFYTSAVDLLWLELKDKTYISYPIETFDYGMREFAIIDCNGYMLQFGEELD